MASVTSGVAANRTGASGFGLRLGVGGRKQNGLRWRAGSSSGGSRARAWKRRGAKAAWSKRGLENGAVSRTGLTTIAASAFYDAPSNISGGTELESLARWSTLVRNTPITSQTIDADSFGHEVCASAAAVTSRTLLRILTNPVGLRQFEQQITSALAYVDTSPEQENLRHCTLDKAMVNVASLLVDQVQGRVSIEVDSRSTDNEEQIIQQVLYLSRLFDENRVNKDRILYRIPATYYGIKACKILESEHNISTLMTLVCSFAQFAACVEAKASVVQLYVGRVRDWFRKHPNAVRDVHGPREDSGFVSERDPGVDLVQKCYNFMHKHHPNGSKLMVGDIRSKEDAQAVAGSDFIVLTSKIIKQLDSSPSTQGYNDGLRAVNEYPSEIEAKLTPEMAAASPAFSKQELGSYLSLDEKMFEEALGPSGRELLEISLKRYQDSMDQLEPYFTRIAISNQ